MSSIDITAYINNNFMLGLMKATCLSLLLAVTLAQTVSFSCFKCLDTQCPKLMVSDCAAVCDNPYKTDGCHDAWD